MIDLRKDITNRLTPFAIENIRKAAKPTPAAEVFLVARELGGTAASFEEIAEIINLADAGRARRAKASDYNADDLARNKELVLTRTPNACFVRYSKSKTKL